MILYLMRHSETDWNTKHLFQGRTDIPLNENGRKIAKWTKEGLKDVEFDVAFCSPLSRAKETAQIVLEGRDITLIEDERIIEMEFGGYEGTRVDQSDEKIRTFFLHPESYVNEKGEESFEEVVERADAFMQELINHPKYQDSTILVVTHGATIRGLIGALKRKPIKDFWEGGLHKTHKNCEMTIVELKNGEKKVLQERVILYEEDRLK